MNAMLRQFESELIEREAERARAAAQPPGPASLTGALVQRGRERAPRLTAPAEPPAEAPAEAPEKERRLPVWVAARASEALFAVACCAAFLASFLIVLRY
jgi:hypothetical protein